MTDQLRELVRLAIEHLEHPDVAKLEFAVRSESVAKGLRELLEPEVICTSDLPTWEIRAYRSFTDGKLVVQIDGPSCDDELTDDGEPDCRVWLNEHRLHPEEEPG